jgi:S-adenosylmethionine:tRNA ribosyltransferase-isomerase
VIPVKIFITAYSSAVFIFLLQIPMVVYNSRMSDLNLADYDYHLPEELIAQKPIEPRDNAKLLVYDTAADKVSIDTFLNLDQYLPSPSLLVFNNTKVLPARLTVHKETGGKVELLLLVNEFTDQDEYVKALSDRKIIPGQILRLDQEHTFTVSGQDEKIFFLKLNFDRSLLPSLLLEYGITPIPKYLGETALAEDQLRLRYQSMFAEKPASVAAPTASLHFTDRVMNKLRDKNVKPAHVTLHVGLGTFSPVTEQNISQRKLHEEYFDISGADADAIASYKKEGKPIVAVGTTTVRTLEAVGKKLLDSPASVNDKTDLFIYPPYDFQIIDGLITNFHLPQSSLMCLVEAFLQNKKSQKKLLELYEIAIQNRFRFYSFGDAMLII